MLERILQNVLPNALMMGVDYELFWTLNPKTLSPFIKAFELKQKYNDTMAWQQGNYIRIAIGSCFDKNTKYPQRPFTSDKVEEKPMSAEDIKSKMMERMKIINSRFRKED